MGKWLSDIFLNPGAFEFNGKKGLLVGSRKNSPEEGLLSVPIYNNVGRILDFNLIKIKIQTLE
jgi:hypothetical protein